MLSAFAMICRAQAVDTTTLEKKARYYFGQIKDNKSRAITPLTLRKAFGAVTNLALAGIIPDSTTHPAISRTPDSYDKGISLFQIRAFDGWPFDGTLLVQKGADGHTTQCITSGVSSFPDQRTRSTYLDESTYTWTSWDAYSLSVLLDVPEIANNATYHTVVDMPGVIYTSRIRRCILSSNLYGLIMSVDVDADGKVGVYFSNLTGAAVNPAPGTLYILTRD